jgi:fido (protein-threonine AMPylation protein)
MWAAVRWLVVRFPEKFIDLTVAHLRDFPFFLIGWLPVFQTFGKILFEDEWPWVGMERDRQTEKQKRCFYHNRGLLVYLFQVL